MVWAGEGGAEAASRKIRSVKMPASAFLFSGRVFGWGRFRRFSGSSIRFVLLVRALCQFRDRNEGGRLRFEPPQQQPREVKIVVKVFARPQPHIPATQRFAHEDDLAAVTNEALMVHTANQCALIFQAIRSSRPALSAAFVYLRRAPHPQRFVRSLSVELLSPCIQRRLPLLIGRALQFH